MDEDTFRLRARFIAIKARAMQAEHEACERTGGHYYVGTHYSYIVHPEEFLSPGWVTKQLFAGTLKKEDVRYASFVCGKCRRRVSHEEAVDYINNKARNSAYYLSRLWC